MSESFISLKKCKEPNDPHPMKNHRERLDNVSGKISYRDRLGNGLLEVIKESTKKRNLSQKSKNSNNSLSDRTKKIDKKK